MTEPIRLFAFTWEASVRYTHGGTTKRQGRVLAPNPSNAANQAMNQLVADMLDMPEDWTNGMEVRSLQLNRPQDPVPNGVGVQLQ